jgi:predicted metal-dependent phosphoesterase TrpH
MNTSGHVMRNEKERASLIVDLHIHSVYSPDSPVEPRTVLKIAKKKGLNGVAVTDHDTIRGGLEALKANTDPNFVVIVGSEVETTDKGDIIGLFLTHEIQSREASEVIKEIKEQGGVAMWAHPYREGKNLLPNVVKKQIDVIEGLNAKTLESQNMLARALAERCRKPVAGVSDAHAAEEIGNAATLIDGSSVDGIREALLKGKTQVIGFKLSHEHLYDLHLPAQQLA